MGWLIWVVAAFWVVRLIWRLYADVQKNLQMGQSAEDRPRLPEQKKGGGIFGSSGPSWQELMRMAREMGEKRQPKDRFDAPDRYRKEPTVQPRKPLKKRRKSKVKERAGWFN